MRVQDIVEWDIWQDVREGNPSRLFCLVREWALTLSADLGLSHEVTVALIHHLMTQIVLLRHLTLTLRDTTSLQSRVLGAALAPLPPLTHGIRVLNNLGTTSNFSEPRVDFLPWSLYSTPNLNLDLQPTSPLNRNLNLNLNLTVLQPLLSGINERKTERPSIVSNVPVLPSNYFIPSLQKRKERDSSSEDDDTFTPDNKRTRRR